MTSDAVATFCTALSREFAEQRTSARARMLTRHDIAAVNQMLALMQREHDLVLETLAFGLSAANTEDDVVALIADVYARLIRPEASRVH